MDIQAVANDLFDELKSRYSNITLGNNEASVTTDPEDARFFKFNWNEYPVSIALDEETLRLIYNKNLTDSVDSSEEMEWYDFARAMKEFAVSHNLTFKPQDMEKLDLEQGDFEFMSQVNTVQESNMHGTSKTSYNKLDRTKMIIRHSKAVDETVSGARSRNINCIFIENAQGERFRFPYNYLAGARAMQMHVAKGGNPYDKIGEAIVSKVEEMSKLRTFTKYALKHGMVDETTQPYLTAANTKILDAKKTLHRLAGTRTYENAIESLTTPAEEVSEDNINAMVKMFTKETFDDALVDAFKLLPIKEYKDDDEKEKDQDISKLSSTAARFAPAVSKWLNDPKSKLILKKDDGYDTFQNNLRRQQKEVNLKLATIMRDIATRFLSLNPEDDAVANFAADMDNQLVSQGELFYKPDPEIKQLKGTAIKRANKYLHDMKRTAQDDDYKPEVRKAPEDMKAFKNIKGQDIKKGKLSKQYKRKYKDESQQFEAWALAQTEALHVVLEDEGFTKSEYQDPFKK